MCSSNTVHSECAHDLGVARFSAVVPRDAAILADCADAASGAIQTDGHSLLLLSGQGHPRCLQRKCQRAAAVAGFGQLGNGEEDCW